MPSCEECIHAEMRHTLLKGDFTYVPRIWCRYYKMLRDGWEAQYCPSFSKKEQETKINKRREETCLHCEHVVLVPQKLSNGTVLVPYCRISGEMVSPKEGNSCPLFRKTTKK